MKELLILMAIVLISFMGHSQPFLLKGHIIDEQGNNNYQLTASLAATGVIISQKINKKSFVQAYGNRRVSGNHCNATDFNCKC